MNCSYCDDAPMEVTEDPVDNFPVWHCTYCGDIEPIEAKEVAKMVEGIAAKDKALKQYSKTLGEMTRKMLDMQALSKLLPKTVDEVRVTIGSEVWHAQYGVMRVSYDHAGTGVWGYLAVGIMEEASEDAPEVPLEECFSTEEALELWRREKKKEEDHGKAEN